MFGFLSETTDPVCKMKIDKSKAKFSLENKGGTYYFCSESCKEKFSTEPKKYLKESHGGCCR